MKILPLLVFAVWFSIPLLAQQPDRWHGLITDQSTPTQTIETLGKP